MKIEFIENETRNCPLISIYGEESFNILIDCFISLANENINEVIVDKLPGYIGIGCRLMLAVGAADEGIIGVPETVHNFKWIMTPSSWDDVAALAEPFYKFSGYYYQWLAGHEVRMENLAMSNIGLVISTYPDGQW